MNCIKDEAAALASEIYAMVNDEISHDVQVILFPPFVHLSMVNSMVSSSNKIKTGAQNCSSEKSGAYTGEVSAAMIKSVGGEYVIIGHSERRALFGDTDEIISKKIDKALENNLTPVFCCGETLQERNSQKYFEVVKTQIEKGIFHLNEADFKKVVIAYEPVWAIGTGVTAKPEQAQEMHNYIRKTVADKYSQPVTDSCSILYGGSCNENNAAELFALPDVDGGLIGGASLKSRSFLSIIQAAK